MGGVYSFPYPENKCDGEQCEVFYDGLRDKLPVEPLESKYRDESKYKAILEMIRSSILAHYKNDKDITENINKNIERIFTDDCSSPLHKLLEWLYTISNPEIRDKDQHNYNYRFVAHDGTVHNTIEYIINTAYDKTNLLYSWKEGKNQFNGVKTVVCFLFILNKIFTCNKNAGICNDRYIIQNLVDTIYTQIKGVADDPLDYRSHSSAAPIPTMRSDFLNSEGAYSSEKYNDSSEKYNDSSEKYNDTCCNAFLIVATILFLLYFIIDKPIFLICIIVVSMIYIYK